MVRITKPLPSANTAVEYLLYRLSQFKTGSERSFNINPASVANLEQLADMRALESRPLLRNLLRIANSASDLTNLQVPDEITDPQNLPLLPHLGRKENLFRHIDHKGELDLGLLTVKKEAVVEFDGEAYRSELRGTYSQETNLLAHTNEEIGNHVLYQNLLDILDKLYDFDMARSAAAKEGKAEIEKKAAEAASALAKCLRDMLKEDGFPFGTINYRLYYKQ